MGFLRFFAVVLLTLALILFGADAVASLEKGDLVMRSFAHELALVNADPSLWLETTLPATVASVLETILTWPGWATLGVLGLAIGALSFGRPDSDDD